MNQFLDELADYLALHVNTNYPISVGDFNIHLGDDVDGNTSLFADTLEALGLIQHVQFPTHNSNNILDLVISKVITNKFICAVLPGPYISDHLALQFSIQMTREQPESEIVVYCDMKGKGAYNVFQKVNLRVKGFAHIDDIAEHLDSQIGKALNEVAQKCEKRVCKRKKRLWYNTTIKGQKTVMWNVEKIWRKYETPETWMANDIEKKRYNTLLKLAKEKLSNAKC